jgi:ATP-dependent helicase/nuclease subunit A
MSLPPSDPAILASDPTRSVWVSAHAGTGKTHTLTSRVARLLLAGTDPQRILCLTFTKAAAAEMQERLFRQLGAWAMLDDAALRQTIAGIGGEAGDLDRARCLFAQALETPGGLKILTIHAFCQLVLSRFPLEAGIAPAFEVLDDQSARALAAEARNRVLEKAGGGELLLAAAVNHLVGEAGEGALTGLLDSGLGADRRRLDRFFEGLGDTGLMEAAQAAHGAPEQSAETLARDFCTQLRHDIDDLKQARDTLLGGSANDLKQAERLTSFLAADFDGGAFPLIVDAMLTREGEMRASLMTKKLADRFGAQLAFLQSLQARVCDIARQWRAARAAALGAAALTLLDAVRREYESAKRARGVLDYNDLILATRNLLGRAGAASWVLYKLDNGIHHVLVDEAQDTSPEQWDILKHLTGDFFAGESNIAVARTVFAVGDEKQSIFSFQGADPAQFAVNRAHFAALTSAGGQALLDQPLTVSRRSAPQILDFVDKVFEPETARAGLTSGNAPFRHLAHRDAPGGIEVWPPLKPGDEEERDIYRPVDAGAADSPVAQLAGKIAARICDWLATGATLPGHAAPISPGDIMILLPRRNPFGGEVIRQLKQRGVPVAGADRMVLTEQIAAMDLMALGRFVLQQEDDLNLAALLRSPLCGLDEEALRALAQDRTGDLWSALVAAQQAVRGSEGPPASGGGAQNPYRAEYAKAHAFLSEMLAMADYAPPFEFYAHALSARGGKEKLLARLGPEAADAIDEFLSLTLAQERGATASLQGFLAWLEQGGVEIKRDMERGRDEVRVMTVHGAKGLEADIVFLPDTTTLREPRAAHLLFDGEAPLYPAAGALAPERVKAAQERAKEDWRREQRRLLYVALTRSRDRLIVCGFENRHGTKEGSWHDLAWQAAQALNMRPTPDGLGLGTLDMTMGHKAGARGEAPVPDWVRRPAPPEQERPRLIRPSDALDNSASNSPLAPRRFRRGLVVHALLARLPEIPPADRARIALAFAGAKGVPDQQALVAETLAVLDDSQFAAAFGPDSQPEAELIADIGLSAPIHGRIDRLAVGESEVLILDFKTNRPPPSDENAVAEVYLRQMTLYRAGAARLFPGRRIVCGLLYTDGPCLIRLSDTILDRQWATIVRRLDPGAAGSYI